MFASEVRRPFNSQASSHSVVRSLVLQRSDGRPIQIHRHAEQVVRRAFATAPPIHEEAKVVHCADHAAAGRPVESEFGHLATLRVKYSAGGAQFTQYLEDGLGNTPRQGGCLSRRQDCGESSRLIHKQDEVRGTDWQDGRVPVAKSIGRGSFTRRWSRLEASEQFGCTANGQHDLLHGVGGIIGHDPRFIAGSQGLSCHASGWNRVRGSARSAALTRRQLCP